MPNKALFLDRDGVVNKDSHFVIRKEDFIWTEGIFEICRHFLSKNYLIIIITNQSGIARNYFSEDDLLGLHEYMVSVLNGENIKITDIYYCSSIDDNHPNRKPNPGMFLKAMEKYSIDMFSSVSIGDKERDIIAARKAGVGTNILFTKNTITQTSAQYTVKNLKDVLSLCI